jgi:CubicO group peptidase (beta-lactamase class C family)
MFTRRDFLHSMLSAFASQSISYAVPPAVADSIRVDRLVGAYLQTYAVPGLSLAYGRGKQIIFAQGYGLADRDRRESVTPQSLFRIASLSKPITAAGIFTLVEAGQLRISDRVFGSGGILRNFVLKKHSDWLLEVTVKHLLTHTAGGWANKEHDPMTHETSRDRTKDIQRTLDVYPLEAPPGIRYAYSNFGYFLLGRVIEQISGVPYGDYVRQHVLVPLEIPDMRLARKESAENEVHYYGQGRESHHRVPVELDDANGGWIATPTDLVHFALGVFSAEDKAGAPELLKPETLREMTLGSASNPQYACGWAVSAEGNYFHSGGFTGSASFLMHRHDGLAWSVVVNTHRENSKLEQDLHRLSWAIANTL